ncbi:hypothetical protein EWM64_g3267 [Hericium alpestre]|uniref:CcmS related domain-containing protein n=1 Tax=Hericium alpestre TaxID=135208 RepID=A0A4Z0A228_9AGAM|nr:hypothetical protein EWM64_g3267 [Hericium alpestre]
MAKANKKGKQKAQPQATERVGDDEDLYGGGHLEDGESNAAAQAQQWNYATPDVGQDWNAEEDAGGWPVEDQQGQWSSAPEPPVSTGWPGAATPAGQPSGSTWGNWDRPTDAPSPAPAPQAQAAQHHQPAPGPSWQNWGAEAAARAAAQGFKPPPTAPRRAQPQHQHRAHFADPANRQDINPQARDAIYAALGRQPAPPQQSKQLKRSKREKQPPPVEQGYGGGAWPVQNDGGWDQSEQGYSGDEGWDNNNQEWGGWDDEPAGGGRSGGRSVRSDGGWDDEAARREYRESLAQVYVPGPDAPSAYPMPSRTLAYASKLDPDALNMLSPGMARRRNGMSDFANLAFVESHGEALIPVLKALFGRERKARDRIHWKFRHDKDERVESLLMWIEEISPDLGAFGLNKFLQTRERGALITNAAYHPNVTPLQPAFDWLTYNDAVNTRDKIIQESIGFYDPMVQVIVFVFLPSKTGNSVAMWRRKVTVPPGVRLAHVQEIKLAMAALKKDYPVYVDELQDPYTNGDAASGPVPPKKKKKGFWGRLFRSFRIRW